MAADHIADESFPFKAVVTQELGPDFPVGTKVVVEAFHDEPHTYVVKAGKHRHFGVSPLSIQVED